MNIYKTQNPERVFAHIRKLALQAYKRGESKIGVRKLIEQTRSDLKVQVNNTDLVLFSDRLRAEHPELAQLIEVRGRGPRGKNKTSALVTQLKEDNEALRKKILHATLVLSAL